MKVMLKNTVKNSARCSRIILYNLLTYKSIIAILLLSTCSLCSLFSGVNMKQYGPAGTVVRVKSINALFSEREVRHSMVAVKIAIYSQGVDY